MVRARTMPDEATLRRWYLDEQIPYRVMSERWAMIPGGDLATPAAFAAKCQKYDWFVPRTMRHMGTELCPWMDIRAEHQDLHDICMLRKESARRQGKVFDPEDDKAIDAYLRGLNEDKCVVEYRRNTKKGFHHVPRRPGEEYVRLPAEWLAAQKVAARAAKKVS